ncbi:MAG: methyltransferase, partial [bacterium]|nr:methyltransferase [bacterium]
YDVVQQLAQPEERILNRFGVDVLDIGRMFNQRDEDWYYIRLADGSAAQYPSWFHPVPRSDGSFEAEQAGRVIARMPAGGTFFDQTCFPYLDGYPGTFETLDDAMGRVLWAALVHSPWDHAGEADFWSQLRARTLRLRESSDRALMVVCGCNLFEWGTFLRRMDNFLMDLYTEPDNVERLLDALMERHL